MQEAGRGRRLASAQGYLAVADKILRDFGELAMGDFRTELNTLQKVHHPHTVRAAKGRGQGSAWRR